MSNSVRNTISVRHNRESNSFYASLCNILGVYLLVILKKNRTSLKLLNYCYTDIVREKICDDFLTIQMKILCDFQIVLFYIPVCWYVVLFKDKEIRRVSHNFLKKNNDFFSCIIPLEKQNVIYTIFESHENELADDEIVSFSFLSDLFAVLRSFLAWKQGDSLILLFTYLLLNDL